MIGQIVRRTGEGTQVKLILAAKPVRTGLRAVHHGSQERITRHFLKSLLQSKWLWITGIEPGENVAFTLNYDIDEYIGAAHFLECLESALQK